jgi:hypothetical protein
MNNISDDASGVKTAEIKRLHEVARANDRTIADLLAALKGAVDFIECVAEDFAYAHKLRDIIAKAEGR